ncbi:MAG: PAS domain-containing protein [Armatimonadetes bacterium]|nr:PAS domain-containing protein [Armatimonadota bacterium]
MADRDRRQGHSDERESAVERDSLSFNLPADSNARGVIVTNADHRVSFTDSRICDLLSIAPSDLMGRDIGDIARVLKPRFADPDAFERRSEWLRVNLHETVEDVLELVSPDRRILHRYSAPLLDESRRPIGRIEVYSDITRRRNLEEANAGLFAQLKSAYEELKATQDQLIQSEKLRAVGEIAGGVANDFNYTLGIILGNIQLLLRTVDDPKMLSRLQAMEQAALDGAETIRRIQEFTRIQPDEPVGAVDLSLLVESVVEVMKPSWESSIHARDCRVDVKFDLAEDNLAAGIAPEIREVLCAVGCSIRSSRPRASKERASA